VIRYSKHVPSDVAEILADLLAGIENALQDNLLGVYLRGSLALGDFLPATSDLDLLVVAERHIGNAEFAGLAAFHTRLAASPHTYANRIEITYLDRAAARRFEPGVRHPTLGQGETLAWSEHGANWILERWVVREHGVTLYGPDPKTLIDPIAHGELRTAVRGRLRDWADWAAQPDHPDWRLPRSHKAYVVETMCRAMYTLACGDLASKPRAVAWAIAVFPEPWRSLVERSQLWRADATSDLTLVPEVRRFVEWVALNGAK